MFSMKKFAKSESAAALMPIALSFFVIIGIVGAAIDIARIQAVKVAAQNAVDAALLGGVATADTLDFRIEGEKLFRANYPADYMDSDIIQVTFREQRFNSGYVGDIGGGGHVGGGGIGGSLPTGQYFASADISVPYKIMQIFGNDHTVVRVTAGVENNLTENSIKAEVALVLDNTGSMEGQKIIDLRTATHLIVERLFGGEETVENLHISIVPFNVAVVLKDSEFPAARNWVQSDWQARVDGQIAVSGGNVFLANRNLDNHINGLVDASNAKPISNETRFRTPTHETPGNRVPWNPLNNGLGSTINRYCPDLEGLNNIAPVIFASSSQAPLHTRIDELDISACTRINVGVMWGWFALSPTWQGVWDAGRPTLPLTQESNVSKIMVVMTDGENTVYKAQHPNVSHDDNSVRNVCAAAKATGVTIYTITLGPRVNAVLMQECATSPAHYFHAPNSSDLISVFDAIAGNIMSEWLVLNR